MVIHVTEDQLELFLPLVPAEQRPFLKSGEWFCLGALAEDEDSRTAAGVIVFSDGEGISFGNEVTTVIEIRWIYVAEKYRLKGLANELMQALSEVLEDNPAEGIICDLPMAGEYDLTEAFLISWGFNFEVMDIPVMIITREDFRQKIKADGEEKAEKILEEFKKPEGVYSILDISAEDFEEAVNKAKNTENSGYYEFISDRREDYAGDISYVKLVNGKVTSLILFERLHNADLHMVMLYSFSPKAQKELLDLLYYASGYFYLNYPERTRVILTLESERSMSLASHLFPAKDPMLMRRGYFY